MRICEELVNFERRVTIDNAIASVSTDWKSMAVHWEPFGGPDSGPRSALSLTLSTPDIEG